MINILRELCRNQKGRLENVSMADLLQMIWLEKMTIRLRVKNKKKSGLLNISAGELHNANCGDLSGRDAVMEMLTWDHVGIELDDNTVPVEQALSDSTEEMLLENIRRREVRNKEDTSKFKIPDDSRLKGEPSRMLRINVPGLHQAIAVLKNSLDGALLCSDILCEVDLQPVASWNTRPDATALFEQLTLSMRKSFRRSGYPGRAKYCMVGMQDGNWAVLVPLANYAWGMILDGERTRLGMLLNVALPKAIEAFNAAVHGSAGQQAAGMPGQVTAPEPGSPKAVKKFTHISREILNRDID